MKKTVMTDKVAITSARRKGVAEKSLIAVVEESKLCSPCNSGLEDDR